MTSHPSGVTVKIVGTNLASQGRQCKEHNICGSIVAEDIVICLRRVQVIVNGKEESAIGAFHVSDGIDRCRIGFLQRHLVKHWEMYEGVLAQVIDIYSEDSESATSQRKYYRNKGCCVAAIISQMPAYTTKQNTEQQKSNECKNNNMATKRKRSSNGADMNTNTVTQHTSK